MNTAKQLATWCRGKAAARHNTGEGELFEETASAIEALEAENERLRAGVPRLVRFARVDDWQEEHMRAQKAIAALQEALAQPAQPQQPLSEEQERVAFEAWMQANFPGVNLSRRVDGSYWDHVPDNFWEACKARAAHGMGEDVPTPASPSLYADADQYRFGPYTEDDDTSNLMGG